MITWAVVIITWSNASGFDHVSTKTLIKNLPSYADCAFIAAKIDRHRAVRQEIVCVPRHG